MAQKPSEVPCTTSDLCGRDDCPIKTGCDANCKSDDCVCDIDADCQAEARICEKDYAGKIRYLLGNDAGNVLLCTAEFVMDLVCRTEEILENCPAAEQGGDGVCPQSEDKPCGCGSQAFDCKAQPVCPKNEECCGKAKPVCCSDGSDDKNKAEVKKENKKEVQSGDGKEEPKSGCKSACPLGKEPKEEEKKGHEVCKEACSGMKDEGKKNEDSKQTSSDSSSKDNKHQEKPHKKEEHPPADSKHDDKKKKKEKEKKDKHKTPDQKQFYEDLDDDDDTEKYKILCPNRTRTLSKYSTYDVPSIKTEIAEPPKTLSFNAKPETVKSSKLSKSVPPESSKSSKSLSFKTTTTENITKIPKFTKTESKVESESEEFVDELDIVCYKSLDCLTTNKSIHCVMTCPKSKSVLTQPHCKTISCSNTSLETTCKCKQKRSNCLKTSLGVVKEIYRIIKDPYLQQDKCCYVCMSTQYDIKRK